MSIERQSSVETPKNWFRMAALAILASVLSPSEAKAALPECHDIGSNPAPTESVRLDDGDEATVECIVDGDTFDARLNDGRLLRIRLWGVDCPESRENEKCMKNGAASCQAEIQRGKKAKELTKQLLAGGKITLKGPFANIKNRKQAYVIINGKDLGLTLIGSCQCEDEYKHKRKSEYQNEAKKCK